MVKERLISLWLSFTMGEEAALGPMWSATGLSGSDRDDKVSKQLYTSREGVVSNKDVKSLAFYT